VSEQSDRTRGLIPFKPGQSGNPSGGRKRKPITQAILAELAKSHGRQGKTKLEAMVSNMVTFAINRRSKEAVEVFKIILSYTDGLPVQTVEIDVYDAARREAEARGLDPDKVVSILEGLKQRRTG
jgi:hypothetical protein